MSKFEPTIKIKDTKFDINRIGGSNLCLQIGKNGIDVCITDLQLKRCTALEKHQLKNSDNLNFENITQAFTELWDGHHWLKAGYWKTVTITYKDTSSVLIPNELTTDDDKLTLMLNKLGLPTNDEAYFMVKHKNNIISTVIFQYVPVVFNNWIKQIYPDNKIIFLPNAAPVIEGLLRFQNHQKLNELFGIVIKESSVLIYYFTDQKLKFFNKFDFHKKYELTYFVLLVLKQLNLSPATQPVFVWGEITETSNAFNELFKRIKHLNFGMRPANNRYGYKYDEVPEHQFFDLFSQTYFK